MLPDDVFSTRVLDGRPFMDLTAIAAIVATSCRC